MTSDYPPYGTGRWNFYRQYSSYWADRMQINEDCSKPQKNKMFGEIKSVDWVSKINLSKNREKEIKFYFEDSIINFHYPDNLLDFNILIEILQQETFEIGTKNDENNCNIYGENRKFEKLIVMDDAPGLSDRSNEFNSFMTVSRKFGYTCLYIFHIIYPSKSIWQMILSQTKIFNIFPSAIQLGNMLKILTNNCNRETINYIPARDLWINRLYFSLSNESKNSCLTIECKKSGLSKDRTNVEGNFEQFCDYGQNKKDRLYNKFLAKKIDEKNDCLVFQIDSLVKTTKSIERKIFKPVEEVKFMTSKNDRRWNDSGHFSKQIEYSDQQNCRGRKKMEEDLDFFLSNNVNQKKIVEKKKYTIWKLKPYNTSRIKSQNILTKPLDFRTAEWSRKICMIEISFSTLVIC